MEMEEETEQGWILGPRPRGANQSGAFVPEIGPVQDRPLGDRAGLTRTSTRRAPDIVVPGSTDF